MLDVTQSPLLLPLPLPLEDPYRQFHKSAIFQPPSGPSKRKTGTQTPDDDELEGSQLYPSVVVLATHCMPMPQHVLSRQQAPPAMQ